MKGDFSRIRFSPARHYTSVLDQQGRVSLDADANEQRAIEEYLRITQTVDTLGESGAPATAAGFHITLKKDGIHFSAGRYYVHGLLCETSGGHYNTQPHLIDPQNTDLELLQALLAGKLTGICLELEVWQRLVTALDDPCLLEPALGQADTTARLQTVWRVVAKPILPAAKGTGLRLNAELLTARTSSGTLCVQLTDTNDDCSCDPIPPAGYTGLENQLYRVEIHHSGDQTTATFKWSRENASIVAAIVGLSGTNPQTIFVDSLGKDANLGFTTGQWVEVTDDSNLFGETPNQPGELYQIKGISGPGEAPSLTLNAPVLGIDPSRNARVRRWDQASAVASGDIPLSTSHIDIESGIQVSFTPGEYLSGDYWLIPARTASGTIDWPPCGKNSKCQPPARTVVATVPLAYITANKKPVQPTRKESAVLIQHIALPDRFQLEDLRKFFAPMASTAIRVEEINWRNDDLMTVDELAFHGLEVHLDRTPTSQIDASVFHLSIETAPGANAAFGTNIGHPAINSIQNAILRGDQILDGVLTVEDKTIRWTLGSTVSSANGFDPIAVLISELNTLAVAGVAANPPTCARVRIRILSRFVSVTNGLACGDARTLYLDGQCFGRPAKRKNGTPSTALQFPSGNNAIASDFESWFFLAPTVQLRSLTFNPVTVTPSTQGNATLGVTVGTVTLVAAVATDTPIQLSVTPVAGFSFSFSTPPPVIRAGQLSVNFNLTVIVQAGAAGQSVPCEVQAHAAWKTGAGSTVQGSFNVQIGAVMSPPQLKSLTFNPLTVMLALQGNSFLATTTGTVSLVAPVSTNSSIQLTMVPLSAFSFKLPATPPVIPAGQISVSFPVTAVSVASVEGETYPCTCTAFVAWTAGAGSSIQGNFNVNNSIIQGPKE